ncbi:uncharacterized protein LOC110983214 [Acanthaster planci]|uniref:Uncharacterized protein LOC110983214 n=1 Tax=Acanthaster planci TaxID=133434 RepID=A0A8B7YXC6_ACAPL|nr:uncharacterized protein LOC110983214 [Acanthaster planci]
MGSCCCKDKNRRLDSFELGENARLNEHRDDPPRENAPANMLLRICLVLLGLWPALPPCSICRHREKGMIIPCFVKLVFSLIVTIVLGISINDLGDILLNYLGKTHDTVFFISYLTNLPHLALVLLLCISVQLRLCCSPHVDMAVFSTRYLQCRSEQGFGGLWWRFLGFMVVPIICIMLRFIVFLHEYGSTNCPQDPLAILRLIAGIVGMIYYGIFCFVVHSLKLSHRREFQSVAEQACQQNMEVGLEDIKKTIRRLRLGFHDFQYFVGMWMTVTVSLATLGMVFLIPFTFATLPEIRKHHDVEGRSLTVWASHTWLHRFMFFVEPIVAVGGLDVSSLWTYLKDCILQKWDDGIEGRDSQTLKEIFDHIKLLEINGSWIKPTLVFSLTSVYLGMKLDPYQDLDPWVGFACRFANLTDVRPFLTK